MFPTSLGDIPPRKPLPAVPQHGQEQPHCALEHQGRSLADAVRGNLSSKIPLKEHTRHQDAGDISDKLNLAEFVHGATVWGNKAKFTVALPEQGWPAGWMD